MPTSLTNWVRLCGGIVVAANIQDLSSELLLDENLENVKTILDNLNWIHIPAEDWYDAASGNGEIYFKYQKNAIVAPV